jgi:hypothetical protein
LSKRTCAIGTTIAFVGLTVGASVFSASAANAATLPTSTATAATVPAPPTLSSPTGTSTSAAQAPETATPNITAVGKAAAKHTFAATATPSAGTSAAPTSAASAAPAVTHPSVTLVGTATPGNTITASAQNFVGTDLHFAWSVDGTPSTVTGSAFAIDTTMIGKAIEVVVTSEVPGDTDFAKVTVTQPAEFVDANNQPLTHGLSADDPIVLTTTAGAAWSYTFHAIGSPTPTLKAAYFDPSEDDGSGDYPPSADFPDTTTFDPSTGVISGHPEIAQPYDFAVSATSGTTTATEYVELDVTAGPAIGVAVATADKTQVDNQSGSLTEWIIEPDGTIDTITLESDQDGFSIDEEPGGQPTIKQGGTLIMSGDLVDKYGNDTTTDQSGDSPITVKSNVASDVISADPADGGTDVTFPHASTHRLSVTSSSFTTAFNVDVTPVVATAATVGTTTAAAATSTETGSGELAYTGSESMGLIPWALGLLGAGIAVTVLRIGRRRRQVQQRTTAH